MTIGERIKFVRKNNNLNQKDFSKRLGISQTHVSKIENNVENPSDTLLLLISYMFVVNTEWLKTGNGNYDDTDKFDKFRLELENIRENLNDACDFELKESFRYFVRMVELVQKYAEDRKYLSKAQNYLKEFGLILRNLTILGYDGFESYSDRTLNKDDRLVEMLNNSIDEFITHHLNVID